MSVAAASYGGEFSSDDDMDKPKQLIQDISSNKNKLTIDDITDEIKRTNGDTNIDDGRLTLLLDHFKISRGPIVESTRGLYKKIVIKRVLDKANESTNNNNNHGVSNGSARNRFVAPDSFSSDEDDDADLLGNVRASRHLRFEHQPMDVDDELLNNSKTPKTKSKKTGILIDSSETESSHDSSSSDDSEVIDVTPVKQPPLASSAKQQPSKSPVNNASAGKLVAMMRPLQADLNDEQAKQRPQANRAKKTINLPQSATRVRSKRIAAAAVEPNLDSVEAQPEVVKSPEKDNVFVSKTLITPQRTGYSKLKYLIGFLMVLAFAAALAYHLRSKAKPNTLLSRAINF